MQLVVNADDQTVEVHNFAQLAREHTQQFLRIAIRH